MLDFRSEARLEDAVAGALGFAAGKGDRRPAWSALAEAHPEGVLLLVDELSEFLRAKPRGAPFNEDVRFLQFLGEWAAGHRFTVVCALQEHVEKTGEIDETIFRKIKDRYPLLFQLTPAHVKSLVAESILIKKPGYEPAVEELAATFEQALPPRARTRGAALTEIYPVHPATLELLEEVRERFSEARGVVDFVVRRLAGDELRGVPPLLDEPWGTLLTPDRIVEHFQDVLELQPEYQAIAEKLWPYYREHLPRLFEAPARRAIAERVLRLLVLVYLSPRREGLTVSEAAEWLLVRASKIAREKDQEILESILEKMRTDGAFVDRRGARYALKLEGDESAELERMLVREVRELEVAGDAALELLAPLLADQGFDPFALRKDEWQLRSVRWHHHDRPLEVFLGAHPTPPPGRARDGLALAIRLPWGAAQGGGTWTFTPAKIERSEELTTLAALVRLSARPLNSELAARVRRRIKERAAVFAAQVRAAFMDGVLASPSGGAEAVPRFEGSFERWLERAGEVMLRRTYPAFERFAPDHGPLPAEAYKRLVHAAASDALLAPDADELVRVAREGYLVPMGLLVRKGRAFAPAPHLDKHELVALVLAHVARMPAPAVLYERLSGPVYGCVDDQVHLLLAFLVIQGEIDVVKGEVSYRDAVDQAPRPVQYDRVVPGQTLPPEQLRALATLADGLGLKAPKQWTAAAQREAIGKLREKGRERSRRLDKLRARLVELEEGRALASRLDEAIGRWMALESGADEAAAFEAFLAAIGTTRQFLAEVAALDEEPEALERRIEQVERFRHVLGQLPPSALEEAGKLPPLDDAAGVEGWLARAAAVYRAHQERYTAAHEEYWAARRADPRLSWRPPPVARSRHVGLRTELAELERAGQRARAAVCRGLVNLEFQPRCACGFDGERAPFDEAAGAVDVLSRRIRASLAAFFAKPDVRERIASWRAQGLGPAAETAAYLEGKEPEPAIEDVARLDEHLSGLELVREVSLAELLSDLGGRAAARSELVAAFDRALARFGDVLFRLGAPEPAEIDAPLARWCLERALESGAALPAAVARGAIDAAAIEPGMIGARALERLESLGLPEAALVRVLALVAEGRVVVPPGAPASVRAAAELASPSPAPRTPEALAAKARLLYAEHALLVRACPRRWLDALDAMAGAALDPPPPPLVEVLRAHQDHEWLLLDCLGLPLLDAVREALPVLLPQHTPYATRFATVLAPTTTESALRALIAARLERGFVKIDAVDRIIHERALPLRDLERLVRTELALAARRIAAAADPRRPLAIFADHGFRLARAGHRWEHGGASTLERTVPVLLLGPRR